MINYWNRGFSRWPIITLYILDIVRKRERQRQSEKEGYEKEWKTNRLREREKRHKLRGGDREKTGDRLAQTDKQTANHKGKDIDKDNRLT